MAHFDDDETMEDEIMEYESEEELEEIFGLGKKTKRNFETVISQLLADNKDAVEAIAAEQDPATKKQMADPLLKKALGEFQKLRSEGVDADVIGNMNEFKRELLGDSRSLLQKLAAGTKGSVSIAREGLEKELEEAYNTIETLRADLNEVNLLNAKLLYTNKLFNSSKNLTESQKLNILTSFDKVSTVKEAKLVFETLNEGLKVKKTPIKESLGMASKAVGTTKTKQSIIESDPMVARFQKLAGII
jgi:flagellar biosynthesis/type III secretory pathway chaperone